MGQLEDLQAAHQAINDKVDVVAGKVDTVQAEVQVLIDKLNAMPPSPDLTAAIASANSILAKVQAVADDLDTTPPAPSA